MNTAKNQRGFSAIEATILVLVIAGLGFVGYMVYDRQQDEAATDATTSQQTASSAATSDEESVPEITSIDDLTKAEQALEAASAEDSDNSTQLDAELAAF